MVIKKSGFENYVEFTSNLDQKIKRTRKYAENTTKILRYLAQNGKASTWDLSQNCFKNHNDRQGDGISRRILEGRIDRGKLSPGLKELGVVKTSNFKENKAYQLTSFGLLYSIKRCHFSKDELYQVAESNENTFPRIFKNTKYFKENKISFESLEKIANGKLGKLDQQMISDIPYYEIMSYLKVFENEKMGQKIFVNFISLWFYTYLLLYLSGPESKTISIAWRLIIIENKNILKWYSVFLNKVIKFHNHRNNILTKSLKILDEDIRDPRKNKEFIDFINTEN